MAPRRPIARLVLVAGVLLLGTVAALRLPTAYPPSWSLPELTVNLWLGESTELADLTRTWILPLESSIRAVGDVSSMAGEVDSRGGFFRVRFRAGTDPERKAARLESELARLRRRGGAGLQVRPAGQGAGDRAAIIWLEAAEGERLDRGLLTALRALPEVRSVEVAGEKQREIRVTPRAVRAVGTAALHQAIDDGSRVEQLGATVAFEGWRIPVQLGARRAVPLGDLWVRRERTLVPLASLARIALHHEEPPWLAHLDGRRGLVLFVSREIEASPLALERSLRRTFAELGWGDRYRLLINEAEPLALLIERLAWGLLAAMLVLVAVTGVFAGVRAALWQGLAVPLALAAALNAYWLAGISLDVTTLPALVIGLGGALFFLALRLTGTAGETLGRAAVAVAAAACLPVAVALGGGQLAPLLQAPSRAFALAAAAAVAAVWILPVPRAPALPPAWLARPYRIALRNPWAVVLAGVTVTYLLLVLTGKSLEPRAGNLSPVIADLSVELRFAPGTTTAQAEAQVATVEGHLDGLPAIEEHWSVFDRRGAAVRARVRRQDRDAGRLRFLAPRLEMQLAAVGASARVMPLAGGSRGDEPIRFTNVIESIAETDEEATTYRFVLRHTDLDSLRSAHNKVLDRLARLKHELYHRGTRSDWGRPATRLELSPRPGVPVAEARRAAQTLARRSAMPPARQLTADDDLALRVMDPRAPRTADEVPQRSEVMGLLGEAGAAPFAAPRLFEIREVVASPTVKRQSGRFVLPVTVAPLGQVEGLRKGNRFVVHRALRNLALPAGTDLELPELNPVAWGPERIAMVTIASALPVLLLALAGCRLDSIVGGLAALAPAVVGVAAATPWIRATRAHVDEMTLLGLAMALAAAFPVALETTAAALASRRLPLSGGVLYRWLTQHAPGIAGATLATVCLLAVPGLGLDSDRHPWVLPLRSAAVAGAALVFAASFVLPVVLRAADSVRHRDRASARRRASPPAWQEPGSLRLEVRNASKIYRDGFQALHSVDFSLEPGIVGLLGPNGAGKTTLLRMLCGLLDPTRGQVRFRGVPLEPANLPAYRHLVGFLPQGFNAYEGFTGAQFLDYWAIERGLRSPRQRSEEVERVLAQVGLEDAAGRKVRDFSGGMRRRIGIARTLLGEPPIVIVDEPTTGLDVESRNRLRETLLAVAGERIILFSTHIASDVAAAAARILLLDQGRLVFDGPATSLIERARGRVFEAVVEDHDLRDFSHRYRVTTRVRTLGGVTVRAIARHDQEPAGEVVEPNLEEAYLAMIAAPGRNRDESERATAASLLDLSTWDSR